MDVTKIKGRLSVETKNTRTCVQISGDFKSSLFNLLALTQQVCEAYNIPIEKFAKDLPELTMDYLQFVKGSVSYEN